MPEIDVVGVDKTSFVRIRDEESTLSLSGSRSGASVVG
ncbi:hypothetical protein ABIA96_007143 [Bradyrhizobium sp. LB11.1]